MSAGVAAPPGSQPGPVAAAELAGSELLRCLPPCALDFLAARAARRCYGPGEVVFREGDAGRSLHIVREGLFKVVRPTLDRDIALDVKGPGDTFGELAVLNDAPRSATLVAIPAGETLELDRETLDRALDEHPRAARRMLGVLARSLTDAKEGLVGHTHRLERAVGERTTQLRETQLELVSRLTAAAESRDNQTGLHIARMSRLCKRLALAAGAGEEQADMLRNAAPMHDLGKIAIPDHILLKPGALTAWEWETMRTHAAIGAELLAGSSSPLVQLGEQIARAHHERWDGSGYPAGLAGEAIPLAARIVAVCDVFDALISDRPYKAACSLEEAFAEIRRGSGTHFDPALAEAFLGIRDEVAAVVAEAAEEFARRP